MIEIGRKLRARTYVFRSENETGRVATQSTELGTKVLKGTEIPITISQGEPIPIQLDASVDLSQLHAPFTIKVTCDGITEDTKKKYSTYFDSTYEISITRNNNEGAKTVEVYIDDELYQSYTFDFDNGEAILDATYEVSAAKSSSKEDSDTSSKSSSSEASSSESETSSRVMFPQQSSEISSELN